MRSFILAAALATAVMAGDWSYTGPSYTMTADVWTSSCTDDTAVPEATSHGTWDDWGASSGVAPTATGWATSYVSAPAASWASSYAAPASSAWASSYAAPATTAAPVASYSASVAPAAYTGAAAHNVVGAGAVAVAGLAMLL